MFAIFSFKQYLGVLFSLCYLSRNKVELWFVIAIAVVAWRQAIAQAGLKLSM